MGHALIKLITTIWRHLKTPSSRGSHWQLAGDRCHLPSLAPVTWRSCHRWLWRKSGRELQLDGPLSWRNPSNVSHPQYNSQLGTGSSNFGKAEAMTGLPPSATCDPKQLPLCSCLLYSTYSWANSSALSSALSYPLYCLFSCFLLIPPFLFLLLLPLLLPSLPLLLLPLLLPLPLPLLLYLLLPIHTSSSATLFLSLFCFLLLFKKRR